MAAKLDSTNPCKACGAESPNGIICDDCQQWWCVSCINTHFPSVLPDTLYEKLTQVGEFPWLCSDCSFEPLPQQLVDANIFTKEQLISYGCKSDHFKNKSTRKKSPTLDHEAANHLSSPGISGEQMVEMFRMMMQTQQMLSTTIQEMSMRQADVGATAQTATSNAPHDNHSTSGRMATARLPKLELQTFSSNVLEWVSYWESFTINVHSQSQLSSKQKFDYLRQTLKGNALDKIKGLGSQGDKYEMAVNILTKEYGQRHIIKEESWRVLRELPMVKDTLSNLERFTDEVRAISTSLTAMGVAIEAIDCFVESHLLAKLPQSIRVKLSELRLLKDTDEDDWTLASFINMLSRLKKLNQLGATTKKGKDKSQKEEESDATMEEKPATASFLAASNEQRPSKNFRKPQSCIFCGKPNHFSDQCLAFPDVSKRKEIAQKNGHCYKCLSMDHQARECRKRGKCFHCGSTSHNSALCGGRKPKANPQKTAQHVADNWEVSTTEPDQPEQVQAHLASCDEADGIIMATALVKASNPVGGKSNKLTVYMDSGSRYTCISKEKADALGLEPIKEVNLDAARFNASKTEKVKAYVVALALHGPKGYVLPINAYAIPNLAPPLAVHPVDLQKSTWECIRKFKPLNPPPARARMVEIDVLLGMDYWYTIMGPEASSFISLEGSLVVHMTPLGNILAGNTLKPRAQNTRFQAMYIQISEDVSNLWRLETIGIRDEPTTVSKTLTDIHNRFKETITFEDGRYHVQWPWKSEQRELPANFSVAKSRLNRTISALLESDPDKKNLVEYHGIIMDQLGKKVIEPVDPGEATGNLVHYISHFPHIRRNHETTKVRIVYDASTKTRPKGICLNDLMYVGINYLQDLVGILLRFRLGKIVMISDIEKAFLQVGLQRQERDCTRFLWLRDVSQTEIEGNLQIYRFTRTPFGIVSSPYLLGATIHHHMDRNPGPLADKIRSNLYMDNILFDVETVEDGLNTYAKGKALFALAGMNLRQWLTNNAEINKGIPSKDRVKETTTKVLGLTWNSCLDEVNLTTKAKSSGTSSKRTVLHEIAAVFDPMGLVSPVTIRGKILLQQLWIDSLDWDTPLPQRFDETWRQVQADLSMVSTLKLKRRVILDTKKPVQLCCFTDASEAAYAAVIYIRQEANGEACCNLLFSKARVAPRKPLLTIPRLELMGVLIGCRAMRFVKKQLKIPIDRMTLWTDSKIVLYWIAGSSLSDGYTTRRVQEITGYKDIEFQYVASKENPADQASRGASLAAIRDSGWLSGPLWIRRQSTTWPRWTSSVIPRSPSQLSESKSTKADTVATVALAVPTGDEMVSQGPFGINTKRYSKLGKLLRVTSYCQRFADCLFRKQPMVTGPITSTEIKNARQRWIKSVQQYLPETRLSSGKPTQMARQLDLFDDQGGIIRCGGRLANARISLDAKYPMLLPKDHHFTKLIIVAAHESIHHSGPRGTLVEIRKKYWIPHGLSKVRSVLKECLLCQKVDGGTFKPPKMGNLPPERLEIAPAFHYTGLDYMGPLLIKSKQEYEKRWIALFSCFTTRAVHLEMVKDCSAEAAVKAIQRFIARRGTPAMLLTDNASQFGKASEFLTKIWSKKVAEEAITKLLCYFSEKEIQWRHIPERSPWVGEFYERLVGLVKKAIKKTLWRAAIDEDSLQTLIASIEATINSRPLLSVGPDLNDTNVLTPANFIAPVSCLNFPPSDEDPRDPDYCPVPAEALEKVWKRINKKLDQFWQLWQTQYLQELRESHRLYFKQKKGETHRCPVEGEVVLLKEKTPRTSWKVARVIKILGNGAEPRFVEIRLPSQTVTRRGVLDIVPLETVGKPQVKKPSLD